MRDVKIESPFHIDWELTRLGYKFSNYDTVTIDDLCRRDRSFSNVRQRIKDLRNLEKALVGVILYSKNFPYVSVEGGNDTFIEMSLINGSVLSAVRSIDTIGDCLNKGRFSDAYVLIRRFRDDLFFYVYLLVGYSCDTLHKSSFWRKIAEKWFLNDRSNFYPYEKIHRLLGGDVSKRRKDTEPETITDAYDESDEFEAFFIKGEEQLKQKIEKFSSLFNLADLNKSYNKILNGSVHGNGWVLQNVNLSIYPLMRCGDMIQEQIERACNMVVFFVLLFLSLLALIKPNALTANDYMNSLENGEHPEEGTQYFVCPALIPYLKWGDKVIAEGFYSSLLEFSFMQEMANPISAYEVKIRDKSHTKLVGNKLQIFYANGTSDVLRINW